MKWAGKTPAGLSWSGPWRIFSNVSLRYCPVNKWPRSHKEETGRGLFLLRVPADRHLDFNPVRCKTDFWPPELDKVRGHSDTSQQEAIPSWNHPAVIGREHGEGHRSESSDSQQKRDGTAASREIHFRSDINGFEWNSPLPHLTKTVLHLMNLNRGTIVNLEEKSITEKYSGFNYFL